jgi:hypothetical protein
VKVYYQLPDDEEFEESVQSITDITLRLLLEKLKYKTMWCLRSLENEINQGKGMIIIRNGTIEYIDFSPQLTFKMKELMAEDPDY